MRRHQDSHLPNREGLPLLLHESMSAAAYTLHTYTESGGHAIRIVGVVVVGVAVVVDISKVGGISCTRRSQPPVVSFSRDSPIGLIVSLSLNWIFASPLIKRLPYQSYPQTEGVCSRLPARLPSAAA